MTSRWHPASQLPAPVRQRVENYQIGFPISAATNLTLVRPPMGYFPPPEREPPTRHAITITMPRKNELHGDLAVGTAQTTNAQPRRPPTAYNPHCRRPSILISARSGCGRRGITKSREENYLGLGRFSRPGNERERTKRTKWERRQREQGQKIRGRSGGGRMLACRKRVHWAEKSCLAAREKRTNAKTSRRT